MIVESKAKADKWNYKDDAAGIYDSGRTV